MSEMITCVDKSNPYEVIKVIEAWELDFHLGTALLYIILYASKKDPKKKEDLEKSIWHLERKLELVKKGQFYYRRSSLSIALNNPDNIYNYINVVKGFDLKCLYLNDAVRAIYNFGERTINDSYRDSASILGSTITMIDQFHIKKGDDS